MRATSLWGFVGAAVLALAGGDSSSPEARPAWRARVPEDATGGAVYGSISRVRRNAVELSGRNGAEVAFLLSSRTDYSFAGAAPLEDRLRPGQAVMIEWVRQDGPPLAVRVDVLSPAPGQ